VFVVWDGWRHVVAGFVAVPAATLYPELAAVVVAIAAMFIAFNFLLRWIALVFRFKFSRAVVWRAFAAYLSTP